MSTPTWVILQAPYTHVITSSPISNPQVILHTFLNYLSWVYCVLYDSSPCTVSKFPKCYSDIDNYKTREPLLTTFTRGREIRFLRMYVCTSSVRVPNHMYIYILIFINTKKYNDKFETWNGFLSDSEAWNGHLTRILRNVLSGQEWVEGEGQPTELSTAVESEKVL